MKTLKEKWLDALPIIWGFISVILLIYLIVWGFSKIIPTDEELAKEQDFRIQSIKKCVDNGLGAYNSGSGVWWCKPIDYKQLK